MHAQGPGLIQRADVPPPPLSRSPSSLSPTLPHHRDPSPFPSTDRGRQVGLKSLLSHLLAV